MKIIIISLDISRKKIGISIGYYENNNFIITPMNVMENYKDFQVIEILKKLKKNYNPKNFLIGIPSKSYENGKFIKNFVHKHRQYLKPFIFQNEDYSTFLSNLNNLKDNYYLNDKNINNDHVAASVILERFFHSKAFLSTLNNEDDLKK